MAFTVMKALYMLVQASAEKHSSARGADCPIYAQADTPAAVPNSEAKMYWLVFFAVMSAGSATAEGELVQLSC